VALPAFVDGRLVPGAEARIPIDDSAYQAGLGCYTTARFEAGRLRFAARAAARLARDAQSLGLPALDPERALAALAELGAAAFGSGAGVVRLQASAGAGGALRLVGTARPLGPEPLAWSALVAPFAHEGPAPWAGAKIAGHPRIVLARAAASAAGCDEALLFDTAGRLVEGARTSLLAVLADGGLVAPPLARGGVRSVAREALASALGDLAERDLWRADLAAAREIVALNAVRGAVAIVRVDGRAVGDAAPGPVAARLRQVLQTVE
jgi:branched-subunit amino acid aminotransferase/4-amino-4-deoxychorismate lyase